MRAAVSFSTTTKWAFSTAVLHHHQASFLHRRLTAEFCGFAFSLFAIPYIWCLGVLFSHQHGSGDFLIVTIKSLTVHGSTSFSKEKEYRHIERPFWQMGWEVFVFRPGCSRFSWGLHGRISRCRAGWQRHCAGFVGESQREPLFPDRFRGGGGRSRSWVIFPFFFLSPVQSFHLASLYHGLTVGMPGLAPTLISFFSIFLVWIFLDCISDTVNGGKGNRSHFLLAWGSWVVWRLHLLRTC